MAALPAIRDEIVRLTSPTPTEDPAMSTLRRLLDYQSRRGQAALYLTTHGMHWDAEIVLRAYFEANRNVSSTAAALGVSRPTVSSRLGAIEEALGFHPAAVAQQLTLALQVGELLPAFKPAGR